MRTALTIFTSSPSARARPGGGSAFQLIVPQFSKLLRTLEQPALSLCRLLALVATGSQVGFDCMCEKNGRAKRYKESGGQFKHWKSPITGPQQRDR